MNAIGKNWFLKNGFTLAWVTGLLTGIVVTVFGVIISIRPQIRQSIREESKVLGDTLRSILERNSKIGEYHMNWERALNFAKMNNLDSAYRYFTIAESLVMQNHLTLDEVNTAKAFHDHAAYLLWNEGKCEEARIRFLIADSIFEEYRSRCGCTPPACNITYGNFRKNKREFQRICGEPLAP